MAEVVTHYRVMCYMLLGIVTVCSVHGPTHVGKEMDSSETGESLKQLVWACWKLFRNNSQASLGVGICWKGSSWMNQSFGTIMYCYKANGNWPKASANHERPPLQKWCFAKCGARTGFFSSFKLHSQEKWGVFFSTFLPWKVHSHPWQRPSWKRKYVTKSVTSHKAGATTASHQQHQTARYPKLVQGIQTVEMIDVLPQPTRILESIGGQGWRWQAPRGNREPFN